MSAYRNNGRPGQGKNYGREDFNRNSPPREMHKTICDKCGKDCEVPFIPTEGKPIYCNDCFKRKDANRDSSKSRNSRDRGPRDSRFKSSYTRNTDAGPQNNAQLAEIINKLDAILKLITPLPLTEEELKTKKKDAIAKALGKEKKATKTKTKAKKEE